MRQVQKSFSVMFARRQRAVDLFNRRKKWCESVCISFDVDRNQWNMTEKTVNLPRIVKRVIIHTVSTELLWSRRAD